ncbi:MAG: class I poly(R)-hydroxyalkanoic acid synthase [Albidovulum sp.]|nr:class I poly(R)-hydroxyalkanoic acid synthase [Albidovulum sp.]
MEKNEMDLKKSAGKFERNLKKIEELNRRFLSAISKKKHSNPSLFSPGQDFYAKAFGAFVTDMAANPSKIMENQVGYWSKSLQLWSEAQEQLKGKSSNQSSDSSSYDRRFKSELWNTHPFFNYVKKQYLLNSEAISKSIGEIDGLAHDDRRRLNFFARQIIDMMSPANFLATNPEALERAFETEGDSLVDGLENLVRDIEANDGELLITLSDPKAFEVGGNIAATEGAVVFRNEMFELIQYAPKTEKVFSQPVVIFPPWINKYYILDLKPENSFIKWVVEKGYTLFVVSWVNPDSSYRDKGIDAYAADGCLAAIREVNAITGQDRVNAVGYCIGGTLLAMVLAYMRQIGDKSIRSASFLTTLTDFKEPGEIGVFLDSHFLDGLEKEIEEEGVLHSKFMSRTFSFLRANDLVYGPAIRSYMMGEAPPAFDLLYWNGDSTNLPGRMAIEYLLGCYRDNLFVKGETVLLGRKIGIGDVRHPIFAVACESDHIAEWQSCFDGVRQMGSREKNFVLAESGHIAGIVNPPHKVKYGHFLGSKSLSNSGSWKAAAEYRKGSWWPAWEQWLARRSGKKIGGRELETGLGPAPGTYVKGPPRSLPN